MSAPPLKRSALTGILFQAVLEGGVPAGRGHAPQEGGWTGQMMSSDFIDYAVIKAGVHTSPAPGEPQRLGRNMTSWQGSFSITGHGETEERSDEAAHAASLPLLELDGELTVQGVDWTIQQVVITRMGATEWSNQDKSWRVTYDVSVHLSRKQVR